MAKKHGLKVVPGKGAESAPMPNTREIPENQRLEAELGFRTVASLKKRAEKLGARKAELEAEAQRIQVEMFEHLTGEKGDAGMSYVIEPGPDGRPAKVHWKTGTK